MPSRDLTGYGKTPPHPHWPNDARVALQFVLNVEEGGESAPANGDAQSETYLHELYGRPARHGVRDLSVEGMYEYGTRAGFWRVLRLFQQRGLPLTAFVVGRVLELTPELGAALADGGHELAGHGYRWLDYRDISEEVEREHIQRSIALIEQVSGKRPVGWYTGRVSANTRRLLREEGGFLYDSDAYNDDLPYWLPGPRPHLVIPYTLVNNDMRYLLPNGFSHGQDFYTLLKDSFDFLCNEGSDSPKLMSVGLHGRISGHPARTMGLVQFLDYVADHDKVWICRRAEIAKHWAEQYPPGRGVPS